MHDFAAPPADGVELHWRRSDGEHHEALTLQWENEAWTATGTVAGADVQYVVRLSPLWRVRQFLLFRDLDDPDLWLATDADGRWGEVNGVYRAEFDGCVDVHLTCTPFTAALPLHRLDLEAPIGDTVTVPVIEIDHETLGAITVETTFTRLSPTSWRRTTATAVDEFTLDDHGLVLDVDSRFRRA